MDNLPRMQVLECFRYLVDDILYMHIFQDALGNHIMQIGLHELEYQIDIFVILCFDCLVKFDYVDVVGLLQDLDLAVSTLGIGGVLESIEDFLKGIDFFIKTILHFPHVAVCT